mgnify:CR=1 FL=1
MSSIYNIKFHQRISDKLKFDFIKDFYNKFRDRLTFKVEDEDGCIYKKEEFSDKKFLDIIPKKDFSFDYTEKENDLLNYSLFLFGDEARISINDYDFRKHKIPEFEKTLRFLLSYLKGVEVELSCDQETIISGKYDEDFIEKIKDEMEKLK